MRLVSTIIVLLAVSIQVSIAQVTYEPDQTTSKSKKNQVDEEKNTQKEKNTQNSNNWISLSSGFSPINKTHYPYINQYLPNTNLISELNYSHRHFLNPNNFLFIEGGIFFDRLKNSFASTIGGYEAQTVTNTSLSFSGRILHNYDLNKFSINTGLGMSLISYHRQLNSSSKFIGYNLILAMRSHFFGIIGINLKLNKNNELGIRTNYQILNTYYSEYHYGRRLIFQLKFNHRL